MANVKISQLTAITSSDDLADADIIPLVDSSDSTTKRAALSVLCSYFGGGGGSSVWCTGTNTAYLLTDCVGIGTATPGTDIMLRVQGDSCYTGDLKIGGDVCIGGDDLFMNTNTSGHILIADGTNFNPVAMSGDVGIDSSGATTIQASSVENSMLAGSIANAKLANDSVSYGGVSLDLGGTDATPAFNLCDATGYPTSSLVGTITNAQLAGSIANAKLANDSVSYGGVSVDLGSSDATPAFNLCDATAYKGDSALVTVGTIASGTWNGTAIANGYLANSSITLSDGSNTTAVSLGGTMTFSGTSNEVDVAESSGTVTVGLPSTVSGLTHVSATCLTGTLQTAAQTNVTSLGTLTALTVDNICLDGSTIGHTSDTDLITLADGAVTIAGDLTISGDDLTMGTNTSGHILVADGTNYNPVAVSGDVSINSSGAVTIAATSVENSMLAGSIANSKLSNSSVSYGGVSLSLGDTDATPAFNLCDATAYKGDSALVTVGTVTSGTWQGTAVATGYIAGTICDKTLASPVLCGTISGNAFLDEDNMASDSATKVASQQSIKAYVDSVASGLDLKCSSHAATTANLSAAYNNGTSGVGATLTNSGTQAALSVDGQTMASGERVLVKDQSTAAQNGIYTVTTVGDGSTNWVLTRATDFDTSTEITSGAFTFVETGSSNADSGWVMTTDGTVTVGTTSLAWSQFSGAGQITAGDGMTKSGNTLNVGAGSNLLVSADAVAMCSIVTGLTTVCATNFAGTLATAAQTNVTSVGTLTALTVDNICLDGTTIGHTDDTDLMTLADGVLTVSGRLDAANDIKVDAIRRYSDSSTTTKILLNDEVIKLNAGHASNEVVKIESGAVTIDGDLTICGDDITMGTNTSGHILVADGTNYNPVAVSGDVTISNTGAVTIAATSVENSMLAGSIANSKLSNSSVSYGGVSLSLGGTDATPAFNLCDATAYKGDSALVTVGTITSGTWNGTAIANANLANDSVSYGGVSLDLGGTDATPAFNLCDATAYKGDSALVTSGALNSGSITSGFGNIDTGSSTITTTGAVSTGSLTNTGDLTVDTNTLFVDASANAVGFGALTPSAPITTNQTADAAGIVMEYNTGANEYAPRFEFRKSRGSSEGSTTIVASGDELGRFAWQGYDGTNPINSAYIRSYVDGTPGTNDMPGRLSFWTTADGASSPTERMTIKSDGRVGIGTTAPSNVLHILGDNNSAPQGMVVTQNGTDDATLQLHVAGGSGGGNYSMRVGGSGGDIGTCQWGIYDEDNSAVRMVIADGGEVGIGTATPGPGLVTMGGGVAATTVRIDIDGGSDNGKGAQIAFRSGGTDKFYIGDAASLQGGSESSRDMTLYTTSGAGIRFYTGGNNRRMDISSDGNVGIGTDSPTATLEVAAGATQKVAEFWGTDTTSFIVVASDAETQNNQSGITFNATTGQTIGSTHSAAGIAGKVTNSGGALTADMLFNVNSGDNFAEKMRLTGGGNLGIGTTSPAKLLHVYGATDTTDGTDPIARFERNGSSQTGIALMSNSLDGLVLRADSGGFGAIHSYEDLGFYTGVRPGSSYGDVAMRIETNGNVGIGTSQADTLLHLESSGAATAKLQIESTHASAGYPTLAFKNDATTWNIYAPNGGNGTDAFQIENDSGGYFIIQTGGNVGIGTTAPTEKLHVQGNVCVTGSVAKGSGSFNIEHPLESKKETHRLAHSFIEGPRADLMYRGIVQLVDGSAQINIDTVSDMTDGTFVALNRCTQVFTTNESNWDAVRGSVTGNILTIESNTTDSTACISWMVVGERCDQHMMDTDWTHSDGRVIVEPEKTE